MEIVKTRHGFQYLIYKDDLIGRFIKNYGWFSPTEIFFLKKLISEDDNVLEIGGNIGSHCIPLSKYNRKGKYFVFEPQLDIFKILVTNISLNSCDNVIPYNYGISDKEETIYYSPNCEHKSNRGAFIVPKNQGSDDLNNEKKYLKLQSFDYFKEFEKVKTLKLIKMDIEGMEPIVIQNIEPIIKKCNPIIFLEYNHITFPPLMKIFKEKFPEYLLYYFNTSNNEYNRVIGIADFTIKNGDNNIVAFHKDFENIPTYLTKIGDEEFPNFKTKVLIEQVL